MQGVHFRPLIILLATAATLGAQPRTGVVTGSLQTANGKPAIGIRVTAVAAGDGNALVSSTLTDASGRYRLEDIPAGRYFIAAGPLGTLTYLPGTTDERKATVLSIASNTRTDDQNFKLAAAGIRISGVVTGLPANIAPQMRNVYRIRLGRTYRTAGENDAVETSPEEDGSFELQGIAPGAYSLDLVPGSRRISLLVTDANIDNIAFDAPPVVTGRVVFEDGSRTSTATIRVIPADDTRSASYPVSADGTFAFATTPGVTYTVLVDGLQFGSYLKSIRSGTVDLLTSRLSMDDDVAVKEIEVVLAQQR
jgi:hypothetical protein